MLIYFFNESLIAIPLKLKSGYLSCLVFPKMNNNKLALDIKIGLCFRMKHNFIAAGHLSEKMTIFSRNLDLNSLI